MAGGTRATYGSVASLTCNRAAHSITLQIAGQASAPAPLQIITTFGSRTFTATPVPGGLALTFNARDPQLDAMAFSRGRFALISPAAMPLYLPSWAEVGRVIEDCR